MIRVMIADDHAIVRRGLKQILSDTDDMLVSLEAGDGDEAFKHIRTEGWDIALLDIAMGGKNILELIKAAKSIEPIRPVLVLSSYPEDQYAIRMLRAGADGYLSKESAPEQLVDVIRRLAAGGKYISAEMTAILINELSSTTAKPLHELLTDREYQVFIALTAGSRLSDIAVNMNLSIKTISTYRTRILKKMNLSTNADLIHYAIKHNIKGIQKNPEIS